MSEKSVSEIGSKQLKWAQMNQAFNAIMFVWLSFRGLLYHYGEKDKLNALDTLFKPFYDELSKDFVPDFYGDNSNSEDKSAS